MASINDKVLILTEDASGRGNILRYLPHRDD
jgi:hypothetical protein